MILSRRKRRRKELARLRKAWWETAEELPPVALYDPTEAFDPNGSYTGIPRGGGVPEQDADDL